jgi:predicted transcriptional regulator
MRMSKLLTRILTKPRKVMKRELTVDMRIVKENGANTAVVLAVIQNSYEVMSITQVANAVGITFPTAHKCLDLLVDKKLIAAEGKSYRKI